MLTRRDILRHATLGSAGLALAPFLQHMQAHAAGDAAQLPKRFVFFTTANGIAPSYLIPGYDQVADDKKPDHVDRVVASPLQPSNLPVPLQSLAPLAKHVATITGLSGKMTRGLHTVGFGTLGAYASGDKGKPRGETIDGALCKAFPSIFPHIGVSCNQAHGVSALGAGAALPCHKDPVEVYHNLFGVISDHPKATRRNQFEGKLLDYMARDVRNFQQGLPSEERQKLEDYLRAFEQMGDRHQQLLAKREELKRLNPKLPTAGELPWEDKVEAMCDLIAQAMIAGLTHVAAINTDGNSQDAAMYSQRCGFQQPQGGHGFGHGPVSQRALPFAYNVSMMARMAQAFQAVPEGNGTMLDHSLLVMVSTSGDSHHTRCGNFPMLLVGNLGGKLRMGQQIMVPRYGKAENRTIGTLYTTLLHAAGIPRDGFGVLDPTTPREHQVNPLSALLT